MSGVPDTAVGFLLENLKEFVFYNADLIAGAEDRAKSLCDELEVLKSFLKKSTEEYSYSDDDFLDKLAKDVRKLVYRAEDAIETYIAKASKHKSRGMVKGTILALDHALELRNIGKELDTIKQEVQILYNSKISLGFQAMHVDRTHQRRIKKAPVNDDDDMVGFKDAMEDVIKLLNMGPEDLQTVSIFGMLGIGKSTLARKVFKHPTVAYQFFIRSFIEVSQEYESKEVFLKILRSFGIATDEMNRMSEDDLVEEIRNYLATRNFLIVLDDVWTPDAWNDLKRCLPNNQKHSRILITTRHKNLAEYAKQGSEPYKLRFLTHEESRELFRKKVFGSEPFPSELEEHETAILDRCDGLPLAIVVVAGILISHRKESYWWKKVAKNVDKYNIAETEEANSVIQLSFKNLPYRLKPCFLYLGVFREDFEIPAKTLLQLWVSEGFVPRDNGKETSEDIAEDYLEELVDRSLVMVEQRRFNGQVKTIRVHDTLREFCKAQGVKEELFREIKGHEHVGNMAADDDRRLCINYNVLAYIKSKPSGKCVRSFLSFAKEDFILPIEHIADIPKAFKLLRVLDIRSIKLTRFPAELYYLFLLKYIAMCSELKIIPEKVSNLRYLETFIFHTTHRRIDVKADIWKMTQLRHLETNASTHLLKTNSQPFSTNANLLTLAAISPESCKKELFDRAPQLKKLVVYGKLASILESNGQGNLFDCLPKLGCLEYLKLINDDTTAKLDSLPSENIFPRKLTRLTLQNTMLDWELMSTLAKLDKLEVLKLKDNAFTGTYWDTEKTGGFGALRVLHIGKTDLVTWKASASNFPLLTHLYLKHCPKIHAIPSDFVNISTLQLIDIYCCNSGFANSSRKLQVAKLQVQASLKLSVYPPDQ